MLRYFIQTIITEKRLAYNVDIIITGVIYLYRLYTGAGQMLMSYYEVGTPQWYETFLEFSVRTIENIDFARTHPISGRGIKIVGYNKY